MSLREHRPWAEISESQYREVFEDQTSRRTGGPWPCCVLFGAVFPDRSSN
jgi:hypothetical protein